MLLTADQRQLMSEARIARTLDVLDNCKLLLGSLPAPDESSLNEAKTDIHAQCISVLNEWRGLN